MKRWAIRLLSLSAVIGLGWGAVVWSQQHWFAQDPALPDLSKPPVNADVVASAGSEKSWQTGATASDAGGAQAYPAAQTAIAGNYGAADTVPNNPFPPVAANDSAGQRYGSEGRYGADSRDNPAGGNNNLAGERYPANEPRALPNDINATPISPEAALGAAGATGAVVVAASAAGATGDDIPAAADTGIAAARNTVTRADDRTDLQTAEQARLESRLHIPGGAANSSSTKNELRINDPNARLASGVAAADGPNAGDLQLLAQSSGPSHSSGRLDSTGQSNAVGAMNTGSPSGAAGSSAPIDYRNVSGWNDSRLPTDSKTNAANPNDSATAMANRLTRLAAANSATNSAGAAMAQGIDSSKSLARSMQGGTMGGGDLSTAGADSSSDGGMAGFSSGMAGGMAGSISGNLGGGMEGFGKPGDKKLEGAQTPSVTIEKIAPPEIQVGKAAKFQIVVKNTGPVPAENVEVTDLIPQGTTLVNTAPATMTGTHGEILWKVGDLRPGAESKLEVNLMPISEGEIGSTATVQFRSAASARTMATKPDLQLELTSPKQVMIGENITVKIKLTNRGTGAASKVMLQAKIPPQLQHPAGNELEFEIGQFKPGETRELDLTLHAIQAGPCTPMVSIESDANTPLSKPAEIEVVAPRLMVALQGPSLRYLDRQAKYTVSVSNPGTASARDINLVARLPQGMKFVDASDLGHYDSNSNAVMWALDELPAGANGSVTLTTLATDAGEQKLRSEVKASGGLSNSTEQVTMVEGVAAVQYTVTKVNDPVEVGEKATYEIHIVNNGSKAANRLQLLVAMPDGIKPISGDGPSKQAIQGQNLAFEPLARLAPKAEVTYHAIGQCAAPGDFLIKVLLQTDEMTQPVTKEESTKVYKD